MTNQITQAGRALLMRLSTDSKPAWRDVLRELFDEGEANRQIASIERVLTKNGVATDSHIVRAYTGSMADVDALLVDVLPSHRIEIVRYLRTNDWLIQCGRGRGRAIVLARGGVLPQAETIYPSLIDASDTASVLNHISVIYEDYKYLLEKNVKLEGKVADLEATILKLREEKSLRQMTTWS